MEYVVKRVTAPLFGVLDHVDKSVWRNGFSQRKPLVRVSFDDAALDLLSEELELEADSLSYDARRYTEGSYREKSAGMGGSQLGAFGEALTYLTYRGEGKSLIRVVGWQSPRSASAIKGARFPQPDFIVQSDPLTLHALEVKTTEAFDYRKLRENSKLWEYLQPCTRVRDLRERALFQLGYSKGTLTAQQHSLKVSSGRVVPFPVNAGEAVAVLAIDGRTRALHSDTKYRTPKHCKDLGRTCWSCQHQGQFTMVSMHNEPGRLVLGGSAGEGAKEWFEAYTRWSQALLARDPVSTERSAKRLEAAMDSWFSADRTPRERTALEAFWGAYLKDTTFARGVRIDLQSRRAMPQSWGWSPAQMIEPEVRELSTDRALSFPQSRIEGAFSYETWTGDRVVVKRSGTSVLVRLLSSSWLQGKEAIGREEAARLAVRMLEAVQGLRGEAERAADLPLTAVDATVGDQKLELGWTLNLSSGLALLSWLAQHSYVDVLEAIIPTIQPWAFRLLVTRDGRGTLRIGRAVINRD